MRADAQARRGVPEPPRDRGLLAAQLRQRQARAEACEVDVAAGVAQLAERRAGRDGRGRELDDDLGAGGRGDGEPGRDGGRQQRTEREGEGTRWQRHRSNVPPLACMR